MSTLSLPGFYEPLAAILHLGAATTFGVLGVRMVWRHRRDPFRATLLAIFASAAVLMLSMSGVFHMLTDGSPASNVLARLDKSAIFILIVATFTPVHAILYRGVLRWAGLAIMWSAAIIGVTLVSIFHDDMPFGLGTTLYLALGWLAAVSVVGAWRKRGFRFVRPVLVGGVAYSIGAILLGLKWPTIIPGVIGPHEVWHVAVIVGLSLHWAFIARLADESSTTRSQTRREQPRAENVKRIGRAPTTAT